MLRYVSVTCDTWSPEIFRFAQNDKSKTSAGKLLPNCTSCSAAWLDTLRIHSIVLRTIHLKRDILGWFFCHSGRSEESRPHKQEMSFREWQTITWKRASVPVSRLKWVTVLRNGFNPKKWHKAIIIQNWSIGAARQRGGSLPALVLCSTRCIKLRRKGAPRNFPNFG